MRLKTGLVHDGNIARLALAWHEPAINQTLFNRTAAIRTVRRDIDGVLSIQNLDLLDRKRVVRLIAARLTGSLHSDIHLIIALGAYLSATAYTLGQIVLFALAPITHCNINDLCGFHQAEILA